MIKFALRAFWRFLRAFFIHVRTRGEGSIPKINTTLIETMTIAVKFHIQIEPKNLIQTSNVNIISSSFGLTFKYSLDPYSNAFVIFSIPNKKSNIFFSIKSSKLNTTPEADYFEL